MEYVKQVVDIELNKAELNHLINDLTGYIWKIKERVFGDDWNFGTDITEVEHLTSEQEEKLESFGYYSRKTLLDKLKRIEQENFPDIAYCG